MIADLFLNMEGPHSTPPSNESSAPGYLATDGELFNTRSFRWLVAAIKASCQLDYAGATVLASSQATLDNSVTNPSDTYRPYKGWGSKWFTLETDWDPFHFIEQQGFKGPDCLPGVLTLSGTANNIQMLPCRQYLRQTWPFAGEIVLDALVDWIKATSSASRDNLPSIESRSTLTPR